MPDEAFEELWRLNGGPGLVGLHALFGGSVLPVDEVRSVLGLTIEQYRAVLQAAQRVGLAEGDEERLTLIAFAPDSAQHGRLEWCLESHLQDFQPVVLRLKSRLLNRYLSSPPGSAG